MAAGKPRVGIQLYSLRDIIPGDVPGNLRRLADMGYEAVEFAGYYGLSGAELRAMLDDCELACAGSHVGLDALEGGNFEKTAAINKLLGTDRLIVPWADLRDLPGVVGRLAAAHARAAGCGMRAGYHNHAREFELVDGRTAFDRIFAGLPGDFLVQLDIGWAAAAGQDVPALLRRYAGRLETVHIKEYSSTNPAAAVGEGEVAWAEILPALAADPAVRELIVEQEQYALGPLESANACLAGIRRWLR